MAFTVDIETAHLPTIPLVGGKGGGASGGGGWLSRFLRPRVVVRAEGVPVFDLAPDGQPGETTWPLLGVALGLVVLVVVVLAVRGAVAFLHR